MNVISRYVYQHFGIEYNLENETSKPLEIIEVQMILSGLRICMGVLKMGHDNLSMFKNLLKYRHESKKQVCDSFTYFRGQI